MSTQYKLLKVIHHNSNGAVIGWGRLDEEPFALVISNQRCSTFKMYLANPAKPGRLYKYCCY